MIAKFQKNIAKFKFRNFPKLCFETVKHFKVLFWNCETLKKRRIFYFETIASKVAATTYCEIVDVKYIRLGLTTVGFQLAFSTWFANHFA